MTALEKKSASGSSPVPVDYKLTDSALTINARCGGCKHFSHIPHPAYGKICRAKGILETSKPCKRFNTDFRALPFSESEDLIALAQIMERIPDKKLPLIAALFNREARTRTRGFYYGMIVYFKAFGGDYISNYRKCTVVNADKNYVYVESKDGWTASVYPTSILKPKEWKKKRLQLEAAKKFKDPNYAKYFKVPSAKEQEIAKKVSKLGIEPPAMDKAAIESPVFITKNVKGKKREVDPINTPLDEFYRVRG